MAMEEDASQIAPLAIDHLVRSYGSDYPTVRELIAEKAEKIPLDLNSNQVIQAQVLHALNEEMAVKLSDFILRRSGLGSAGKPEEDILTFSADIMAAKLMWDESKRVAELEDVKTVYDQLALGERI
jgi:glycerol-3-phosphate dehydrogenase